MPSIENGNCGRFIWGTEHMVDAIRDLKLFGIRNLPIGRSSLRVRNRERCRAYNAFGEIPFANYFLREGVT